MTIKNDLGFINISPNVIAEIAGCAATGCFGVKGMTARSVSDGISHLLRRENMSRGVRIEESPGGGVNIDLHLAVEHGVNIAAICRSIMGEVRYNVESMTGIDVNNIDVYVESVRAE